MDSQEVRQRLHKPYHILFVIHDDVVYVLHIRHAARKRLKPGEIGI